MKKRKTENRLDARKVDYDRMIATGKGNYSGYHKPGSNKK